MPAAPYLTPHWRGVYAAEALNEALAEMRAAHGHWRAACRHEARRMVRRMRAERDAGYRALHEAVAHAHSRRMT